MNSTATAIGSVCTGILGIVREFGGLSLAPASLEPVTFLVGATQVQLIERLTWSVRTQI
jgi:hypothetical protein